MAKDIDIIQIEVGTKVEVFTNHRCNGTIGGWEGQWRKAIVRKVNRKTIDASIYYPHGLSTSIERFAMNRVRRLDSEGIILSTKQRIVEQLQIHGDISTAEATKVYEIYTNPHYDIIKIDPCNGSWTIADALFWKANVITNALNAYNDTYASL